MKTIENILVLLVFAWIFTGCAPTYKIITISEDGSALMISDNYRAIVDSASGIKYYVFVRDTVSIKSVDSINAYLNYSEIKCYVFDYTLDTFNFKINDTFSSDKATYYLHTPSMLKIEFPNKIIDISGQGKILLDRNSKTIAVKKSKNNYFKSGERVNITVSFGQDSVNSLINHPFGLKRFGYALDPLPGYGPSFINGPTKSYLEGDYFMNWGFSTLIFNQVRLIPRMAIMIGRTKDKITELKDYTHFDNTNLEIGIGYELLNTTFINVTPTVYGGANKLEFYREDKSIPNITKNGGFKFSIGTTVDLKINPIFIKAEKREAKKNEYFYIKIDGGWYPNYFKKSLNLNGSTCFLTFSIGGYIGGDNMLRKVKLKK